MRVKVLAACVLSTLPMVAQTSSKKLDQNEASTMRHMNHNQQHSPNRPPAKAAQLSDSDQSFLKALVQEDISEIGLAKMALQKSSNNDVKQYAQTKILAADPGMRDGAQNLLRKYGIDPPAEPSGTERAIHDKLSKKTGKDFDGAYMIYETTQQSDDVKLVNAELKSTTNAEVKSFVEKEKAPVVEAATSAKEISAKLASEMRGYRQPAAKTPGTKPGTKK